MYDNEYFGKILYDTVLYGNLLFDYVLYSNIRNVNVHYRDFRYDNAPNDNDEIIKNYRSFVKLVFNIWLSFSLTNDSTSQITTLELSLTKGEFVLSFINWVELIALPMGNLISSQCLHSSKPPWQYLVSNSGFLICFNWSRDFKY